jgi:ceramide glucosyltransferase
LAAWLTLRKPRLASLQTLPPVTILKPVKGNERTLYENLKSFCRLDYPVYQLLFAASDPDDPALKIVSRLKKEYPLLDIEIVISAKSIGTNPKINNLANTTPLIKHDFIAMSDSDVLVETDFLRRAMIPFKNEDIGLVTCLYRCLPPHGIWERLEALAVETQFLPQAITAIFFGMRFAMGAALVVRKEAFDKAGGFKALADHLADDFVLGRGIESAGYRIEIAEPIVETAPGAASFGGHLRHQIRWAKTIRLCRPAGYTGLFFMQGFSFLTLKMIIIGPKPYDWILLLAIWAVKASIEPFIFQACLGDKRDFQIKSFLLIPLSEWTTTISWLAGFGSSAIDWRGESLSLADQGRLADLPPAAVKPQAV